MLPVPLAREIDAIAADNVTGAMALVRRAAEAVRRSAAALGSPDAVAVTADSLEAAQPAMAPMFHLAERLRRAAQSDRLPASIARCCHELLEQIESSDAAIARHALALFPNDAIVLTHSYSATVAAVLEGAHSAGKLRRVIATESRPVCEGVQLARRLAESGIAVDLVVDAAMTHVITEAQLVLAGADTLSAHGLVNKIGTRLAALAAREQGLPFYVACSSLKIAPAGFVPTVERPRPASEIVPGEIPGCRVRNYYFDTTPLELLTGVVTENGRTTDYPGAGRQASNRIAGLKSRAD